MVATLKNEASEETRVSQKQKTPPRSIKKMQREYLDIAEATDQLLITEIKCAALWQRVTVHDWVEGEMQWPVIHSISSPVDFDALGAISAVWRYGSLLSQWRWRILFS